MFQFFVTTKLFFYVYTLQRVKKNFMQFRIPGMEIFTAICLRINEHKGKIACSIIFCDCSFSQGRKVKDNFTLSQITAF